LGSAYGQQTPDPEQIVRRIIDDGVYEGFDQKMIGHMGDAGAVLVARVLAGRDLAPQTIDNALVILDSAFADPNLVEVSVNKEPRTALLLLRYFELSAGGPGLKKRIADTSRYVQDRYAASLRPSSKSLHN
jgi:hypothetical protein